MTTFYNQITTAFLCGRCGLQAGLARFPHSAHMVLVYVNFLGSVVNSQQACSSQLQATKKLEPNWLDRFAGNCR
jgi:hypothetical protein